MKLISTLLVASLAQPAVIGRPDVLALETLPRSGAAIPVTFVLMNEFGDPRLLAAVRLTPGPAGLNMVILKRSSLTPELLFTATQSLTQTVKRFGARPAHKISVYFMRDHGAPMMTAQDKAWAQDIIERLVHAKARTIPALGSQPAITLSVPMAP